MGIRTAALVRKPFVRPRLFTAASNPFSSACLTPFVSCAELKPANTSERSEVLFRLKIDSKNPPDFRSRSAPYEVQNESKTVRVLKAAASVLCFISIYLTRYHNGRSRARVP